ncbi:glycosyltransferase domain-containing protein [Arundinibacter roseus]|uniref:PLOD1-3-like GT domain-containing protein n=1 Tax=Arundinibacter roseus TaxID=2070510 RepID=A0A4R4JTH0_9BACT|nr:glycosyltransferase domain-containing protein [Arundinibacter roseus]TDB57957.1 hypothetical protein EZE20_23470 [Arundinibacter roseus]
MIVLSCITNAQNKGYQQGLKASCAFFNLEIETIVINGPWRSHRLKDQSIQRFLMRLNPEEIVLFTDGYDVVFVANEKEILEKYQKMNSPVVFSTEANCYPYSTFSYLYQDVSSKFRYLNSGGYIGTAGGILKLHAALKDIDVRQSLAADNTFQWSNQYHWTKLYLYIKNEIKLDTDCTIFQTFANDLSFIPDAANAHSDNQVRKQQIETEVERIMEDFDFSGNRLINKVTESNPCHLHFNSIYLKDFIFSSKMKDLLPWMNGISVDELQ